MPGSVKGSERPFISERPIARVRLLGRSIEVESALPEWLSMDRLNKVHAAWVAWIRQRDVRADAKLGARGYELVLGRRRGASLARPTFGDILTPTVWGTPEQAYLKDYQVVGRDWLLAGQRRLLADEMGLGKTVQVVAAMAVLACQRDAPLRALVVCPTSVVHAWLQHLDKFGAPLWGQEWARHEMRTEGHVTVVSHATFARTGASVESKWDLLVVDEAHRARNRGTQVHAAIERITASQRWFLSGTPLERDDADLVGLLRVLGVRGFETPSHVFSRREIDSAVARVSLRRTKADTQIGVPTCVYETALLPMEPAQSKAHEEVRRAVLAGSIDLFAGINRMREIADIDNVTGQSNKVAYCLRAITSYCDAGEKLVVFSFLLEPLDLLALQLPRRYQDCCYRICGDLNARDRQHQISEFSKCRGGAVMLASSRACGEGITLTAANRAILINEWWNPSTNDQITARLVRFGQQRECTITRLRSAGSIDERLSDVLASKMDRYTEILRLLSRQSGQSVSAEMCDTIRAALL